MARSFFNKENKMKKNYLVLIIIAINLFLNISIFSNEKIEKVILYREQALITKIANLDLPAGSQEVVITKLPSQLIENSLYAEGDGVEIRAVQLRKYEVKDDPEENTRELDASIELKAEEIQKNSKQLKLIQEKLAYLTKQETFTVDSSKLELSKGILNSNTLKEITLFHFEQKQILLNEELGLEKEQKKLTKELSHLQRQRKLLTKTALTTRDAIIFIDKKSKGPVSIRLNYLVNSAGWTPEYNFYLGKDGKNVKVEFNARIHQVSGEDWDNIELVLSNASPALSAIGPGLSPFKVNLSSGELGTGDIASASQGVSKEMGRAYKQQLESKSWEESQQSSWALNSAANDYQNLELVAKDSDISILKKETISGSSTPSVGFTISTKVNLASKNLEQLIRVNSFNLPSTVYTVATPILTNYIFKEAEIQNNSLEVLLAGKVSAYHGERFVGRADIPNVVKGQMFIMGFGIDSQLKAFRELVDKKEKNIGGNKEVTFKFKIRIENYNDKEAPLRVLDRVPIEEEKGTIRMTINLHNNNLSEDKNYLEIERPKGILRWDANIPANVSGEKSKIIEYEYKLEFDRNLFISQPVQTIKKEQLKNEYMEMQKSRYNMK